MLTFRAYDAAGGAYPPARLPVVPLIDRPRLGRATSPHFPSAFLSRDAQLFARGRYALRHAFQSTGIAAGTAVAVPAYHCRTMIDPAMRLGADVVLYALRRDLSPDLDELERRIRISAQPVKALLLPHYFGFMQDLQPILDFCRIRGIALIEDCSHTFFGQREGRVAGTSGACAIASPGKFFACDDGGAFRANVAQPSPALRPRALRDELQAMRRAAGAVRDLLGRHDAPAIGDAAAHEYEALRARTDCGPGDVVGEPTADWSEHYAPELEHSAATRWTRLVMRSTDVERLAQRRRAHYGRWLEATRALPHCEPLFDALPQGVVPYMFPLRIASPQRRFHWLKHLRVPMYRWDELAQSDCAVSAHLRLHLIHLPCHQALSDDDMAWMAQVVAQVLRTPLSGDDEMQRWTN